MRKVMRKTVSLVFGLGMLLSLNSCYSSSVCIGDMDPDEPAIKVASVRNSHFIAGLAGRPEIDASRYVGDAKDYKVQRSQTFVDGLLSSITFGVYTPTHTTFYVPYTKGNRQK